MSLYVDIEKELASFKLKVNIEQESGILGFLGESGSGKSMTLKCIAGLENPTRGKIILNNKILFDSDKKINLSTQERNVGFLFQNYALFPHMTVSKNIELGLENLNKEEKKLISKEYIERLCLKGLENRYPWQLSGGQQQRVALARALATSPDILLLDEPFSALDYHLRSNMEKELVDILSDYKGDIIFVTHDIEEAYRVCDDIMIYDKGRALPKRKKKDLFEYPKSLVEAKITGCSNISRAEKISNNSVYAVDWGYVYNTSNYIDDNIKYIGIREHHLSINEDFEDTNIFYFKVENIVENPFKDTIYIKNYKNEESKLIKMEVNKGALTSDNKEKILVKFDEEKIFVF